METEQKKYELSLVLKSQSDLGSVLALLTQLNAKVSFQSPVSELRLAYPIKKYNMAFFAVLHFDALPESVEKLSKALNLNPVVLRFLTVTPPIQKMEERPRRFVSDSKPKQKEEVGVSQSAAPVSKGALTNEALSEKLEEILK